MDDQKSNKLKNLVLNTPFLHVFIIRKILPIIFYKLILFDKFNEKGKLEIVSMKII